MAGIPTANKNVQYAIPSVGSYDNMAAYTCSKWSSQLLHGVFNKIGYELQKTRLINVHSTEQKLGKCTVDWARTSEAERLDSIPSWYCQRL